MIHHTHLADVAVCSWEILNSEWEITSPALIDTGARPASERALFARLNYNEALIVASALGGELLTLELFEVLRETATVVLPPFLGTPRAENGIEHSIAHDDACWNALIALNWYAGRGPVAGCGKHWIAGAPPGKSRLVGWDKDGDGPGKALWQPPFVAHNREHFDDGTTTLVVRRRDHVA